MRSRLISLLAALALTGVGAGSAFAHWTSAGDGAGSSLVGTLSAPEIGVPATAPTGSVEVTWTQQADVTGDADSEITYTLERKLGTGSYAPVTTGDCAEPLAHGTTSCTDTVDTSGSYTYRAVARFRSWTATSADAGPVEATVPSGDTDAPELVTLEMLDTDSNGRVDQVEATFDEDLEPSTDTDPWTLTDVPSGGTLDSVSTSGAVATLAITEGTGAPDTAVGDFEIALAAAPAGIRDEAGNEASFAATAPDDKAAPAKTLMEAFDSLPSGVARDGKIDQVKVGFSETVASVASNNTGQWAFSGAVPSGGTLTSVDAPTTDAPTVATLNITPANGAPGTPNTAIGTWQIALSADAAGIRDAAGNTAEFSATAPADKASPVFLSLTDFDGTTDGRFEGGDYVTMLLSETVANSQSTSNVVLTGVNGNPSNNPDVWRAPGFLEGTDAGPNYSLGNGLYMLGNNAGSATFAASQLQPTANPAEIRLTLSACTGSCTVGNPLGTADAAGALAITPATTITDTAGNPARPNSDQPTFALKLF